MQNEPNSIEYDPHSQMIQFIWSDDDLTLAFQPHQLRLHCPCVFCRAQRIRQPFFVVQEDIAVKAINSQRYGVQICFSDGHDKGIFPWAYLREIA